MPYATFGWRVVMRITESSPNVPGTADFTLPNPGTNDPVNDQPYWVTGADAAARKLNAENCAREECKNMLTGTGRTTIVVSSSQVATR